MLYFCTITNFFSYSYCKNCVHLHVDASSQVGRGPSLNNRSAYRAARDSTYTVTAALDLQVLPTPNSTQIKKILKICMLNENLQPSFVVLQGLDILAFLLPQFHEFGLDIFVHAVEFRTFFLRNFQSCQVVHALRFQGFLMNCKYVWCNAKSE